MVPQAFQLCVNNNIPITIKAYATIPCLEIDSPKIKTDITETNTKVRAVKGYTYINSLFDSA